MDCCDDIKINNKKESEPHLEPSGMSGMHSHQEGYHDHSGHRGHSERGSHSMNHGSASGFLVRFWIVTALLIPLALSSEAVSAFLGIPTFGFAKWIQFVLATIIFLFSLVFFRHAKHEIMARQYGMMTLVSLAVGSGYAFSVVSTFVPSLHAEFYLEISTLIWVLLFGHYLEARASVAGGDALKEVAALLPKEAHLISVIGEEDVSVGDLKAGDVVIVKPGEKVPADGVVEKGQSQVNESLITGESRPVIRQSASKVVAGSIVIDGSITVKLSRVGEHSTVGQIKNLIASAEETKPRAARIADKAAAALTFVALGGAILTVFVWSVILGQPVVFALTLGITVLVIACPHALGMAIPAVTAIATSLSSKSGLFVKNLAKLEVLRKADHVLFDKTGTLTEGKFAVHGIFAVSGVSEREVAAAAASLERQSSHIIGKAIEKYATDSNIPLSEVSEFKNVPGKGVVGSIDGEKYFAGNRTLAEGMGVKVAELWEQAEKAYKGKTLVFVGKENKAIGFLALSDAAKPRAAEAVSKLKALGVEVSLLTGDGAIVARDVSTELGISEWFSDVLPEDKLEKVKELQKRGKVVVMVGDGVNDAPALTQADVGVAIGAGVDVAAEAGDIVLLKSEPMDLVRLVVLSRRVYGKMVQNLIWALGYNIVAIPAAAGVFAGFGFILSPQVGALVMSLSTVIVVLNAFLLKRLDLTRV